MIHNYCNTQDFLSFLPLRLDEQQVKEIAKLNSGLTSIDEISCYLASGDYIPVVKAVWAEKNELLRLNWLKEQEANLHAPLLAELGLAEFMANPTTDTVCQLSFPLIKAASKRVAQDALAIKDASLQDAMYVFELTYTEILNHLCQQKLNSSLYSITEENKEKCAQYIKDKLKEVFQKSIEVNQQMPNPIWIGYHGLEALFGKVTIYPQSEINDKQKKFAENLLKDLQKLMGKASF